MLQFLGQGKEKTERATEMTRRRWFGRVVSLFRGADLDDAFWEELEEVLVLADVGVGPTTKLLRRLRDRVRSENVGTSEEALDLLKHEMVSALTIDMPQWSQGHDDSLLVILMVGVNGSGKTTSIAKIARMYSDDGKNVLLGAGDTFRAAAIDQIQVWGERLGISVVAHQTGGDPAAVAFDTLQAARGRKVDVAIIDTAGRLHTKHNLMQEIKKVKQVLSRKRGSDEIRVLLTIDATTGRNGLIQARAFTEALQCDGVFLAKLDGTAKGGVVLSICDELNLPVLYIGTGERADDIMAFDPKEFIEALFLVNGED